jgi:hypothetical protein
MSHNDVIKVVILGGSIELLHTITPIRRLAPHASPACG